MSVINDCQDVKTLRSPQKSVAGFSVYDSQHAVGQYDSFAFGHRLEIDNGALFDPPAVFIQFQENS